MSEPKKKLIEVALPLEAINKASAREKSIRHGHPSTLHLWWARRPLAACRAVLFASLVDDPSSHPEEFPTEEAQEQERQRLFKIIEELVLWENSNNEEVLAKARKEIMKSTGGNPPAVLDPFCGGGSIPLEAQRLGLEAHGSDLNPVAVLITKALIEIPPKFADLPPINPESRKRIGMHWKGAEGLADDVRYYGKWMRDEAEKRIGHLYPKVKLPKEYGGGEATVIAWLWARTVKCPNPACGATMPLVRSFWLSTKKRKKAWVEPVINGDRKGVTFEVNTGEGEAPEGTVNRRGARCICCGQPVPFSYIRSEGQAGRMGSQMMAIVAEGKYGRIFLSTDLEHENISSQKKPQDIPITDLPEKALGFRVQAYGFDKHYKLFTNRQLIMLKTFCELLEDIRNLALDHIKTKANNEQVYMNYLYSILTYLSFAIDRTASMNSSLCWWNTEGFIAQTFARPTLSMVWDFAECNPLSNSTGNWLGAIEWICNAIIKLPVFTKGDAIQADAKKITSLNKSLLISTDPPYYDNIGYSDLSDFFYIWLRKTLGKIYPELFSTLLVPKAEEIVASEGRFHGNKSKAKQFFEDSLYASFCDMRGNVDPRYPITIYYAFKQTEERESLLASTGWEAMLEALIRAGFIIVGTWPMRTERNARPREHSSNALASSIVLVCRIRPKEAQITTRREFLLELRKNLPEKLKILQFGNIPPVDLAQAAIGPGMEIYSKYEKVLEANGDSISVRTALHIINHEIDNYFFTQEDEIDDVTRFCIAWFEQYGFNEQLYGEADILAKAKNISLSNMVNKNVIQAYKGKVKLIRFDKIDSSWQPSKSDYIWACTQRLVRALNDGGEQEAALLAQRIGSELSEAAKSLAYRLYMIADRKGWTEEALAYNTLVVSWPAIKVKLANLAADDRVQQELF